MIDKKLYEIVRSEISGSNAKRYVEDICRFHRIQASPGFSAAAEYVLTQLKKNGIRRCKIENYRSDGFKKYFTWHSPVGWEGKQAALWMIEPEKRLLSSFPDSPCALAAHSNSASVTAQLVDVGEGVAPEDYKHKNVKGKIVLCSARTAEVVREAVIKRGAVGLVGYIADREDEPDILRYNALWPEGNEIKRCGFGFSVSRRTADYLKSLLSQGKKVLLRAKVDAHNFPSKLNVVTAEIKGKSESGILFIAHLCHPRPGANDNASGSGLLIELARALVSLISQKKIVLKRTIRFMWVPEMYGTLAYLSRHTSFGRNTLCAINLDMVGENQSKCNSKTRITRTPWSCPSNLADLLEHAFSLVAGDSATVAIDGTKNLFHFDVTPYSGGSDHYIFCESTWRVPSCMVGSWPDTFYHTDTDSPDKTDSTVLQKVGVASLFSALFLANADSARLIKFLSLAEQKAQKRISDAAANLTITLQNEGSPSSLHRRYRQAESSLGALAEVEILSLFDSAKFALQIDNALVKILEILANSVKERFLVEGNKLWELYKILCKQLKTTPVEKDVPSAAERRANRIYPKRLFAAPLDLLKVMRKFPQKENYWREVFRKDGTYGQRVYETLNYSDGKRSLFEIWEVVDAQFPGYDIQVALRLVTDLKELRLIRY